MKIVITDSLSFGDDVDLSQFKQFGEVEIYRNCTVEEAALRVEDADIIVVCKVPMNESTLKNAKKLKMIALAATGYNNVDLDYANSRNIRVANSAGYSTNSIVQHTFALLFYVMEKLSYYDKYVKSGDYSNSPVFTHFDKIFMELDQKTWGIIGLGEIGRNVGRIAKAFGCRVIYYSTSGNNNNSEFERVSFDQLLSLSDVVSVHGALNASTENLMDYEAFTKMKRSSIFLNLARGPIVNEWDLARALEENLIDGAGLDVISKEPIEASNPLLRITDSTKLIITPHLAWATFEARSRLLNDVHGNIEAFLRGDQRNVIV